MTRDDLKWSLGLGAALIMAAATLNTSEAAYIGIPAVVLPYLRLAELVVGVVCAYLKTSPLPGAGK